LSNIYLKLILKEIPRLLGLLDRNPVSPTFGCFDRNYWHYNVSDFPCARFQEAVLTLSLLYMLDDKNNPYFNDENVLFWINGAVKFWCNIQRKDGSFDEWYPYEHSFVATAFSTYAISETLLLMGDKIKNYKKVICCIEKASDFIIKNVDYTACNQETGAIIALYNTYLLTSDKKYEEVAFLRLEKLSKMQSSEGWFPEYGSADIGYLSLAVDYLCKLHEKSKAPLASEIIDKALDFLYYFVHPDGTFGGEYGSRNTKYIIPSGIEYASSWNEKAKAISLSLRESLEKGKTTGPYNLDDRYLSYIGYTYIQASKYYKEIELIEREEDFRKNFSESGIFILSNKNFYFVVNLRKGGVLRLNFKNTDYSLNDSGCLLGIKDKFYTSGWLNPNISWQEKDGDFLIETSGLTMSFVKMSLLKNILLRIFQMFFGNFNSISKAIKSLFRNFLISYKKESNVKIIRKISFKEDGIVIEDEIDSPNLIDVLYLGMENPYIFIPSSRYFQECDLSKYSHKVKVNDKKIKVIRSYDWEGKEKFTFSNC